MVPHAGPGRTLRRQKQRFSCRFLPRKTLPREDWMSCQEELRTLLDDMGLEYEFREHPEEYTAVGVAHSEDMPLSEMAKVVICIVDKQFAMFVVPASARLDLGKAAKAAAVPALRLAREDEFQSSFSDCEVGAMPPFGNLYGIPTFVDSALVREPEIAFQAGSHTETIAMKPSDYCVGLRLRCNRLQRAMVKRKQMEACL